MSVTHITRLSRLLAGLSGASAVAMGAYGAHMLKPSDPHFGIVFQRANQYHLIHSFLLGIAPLARFPAPVLGLATAGVISFSGSCYAVALTEEKSLANPWAPLGGFAFIGAWLAMAL